jgi:RNA polymerase sigma-70 factor (ECF subfamily)
MIGKDQLIGKRIQSGDIRAFEKLFHAFYPPMCAFASSLVKSDVIAEEIVQDIFYNIWKNRATLFINQSWKSYLLRAVHNHSLMHLRKQHKEEIIADWKLPDELTSPDPSSEVQLEELKNLVGNTLNKLPERTREIFEMNRTEGLKYKEIAEKLSISVKTVEANMGRALQAFRNALRDYSI